MDEKQAQQTLSSDKILKTNMSQFKKKKVVFKDYCQNQEFLLPKNIDDFIGSGHIARLISRIIDRMDLKFVFDTYKGGGTSAFDPRMMLKCWILSFINRVYSCRLVAKNLRENLAFIWISGDQRPDYRTLNNFRLRLKDDIKKIFKQIVLYGLEVGIIEGKDVFVDHSKYEANSNKHKVVWKKQVMNQSKKIDEELDELFKYIDEINEKEEGIFGSKDLPEQERNSFDKEKVKQIIDKINKNIKENKTTKEEGRQQRKKVRRTKELIDRRKIYKEKKQILGKRNSYSRTDHDAVAMMMKDKLTIRPAYNEGVAVENGFVLNYDISNNCGDCVSFIPIMEGVIDNIERVPDNANADAAYGNEENSLFLEENKINDFLKFNTYHKEKSKAWRGKKIRFPDFIYNKEKDEFICKNQVKLKFFEECEKETKTGYIRKFKKYKAGEEHCTMCPYRDKCTKAKARTLEVSWKGERLKEKARQNLESKKGIELRKRRGNEVESVFGDQKLNKTKRRYLLRGLDKVTLEAGLYYISHNLRKIHNMLQKKYDKIKPNKSILTVKNTKNQKASFSSYISYFIFQLEFAF